MEKVIIDDVPQITRFSFRDSSLPLNPPGMPPPSPPAPAPTPLPPSRPPPQPLQHTQQLPQTAPGTEATDFPSAAIQELVPLPQLLCPMDGQRDGHCRALSLEGDSWGWAAPGSQQDAGGLRGQAGSPQLARGSGTPWQPAVGRGAATLNLCRRGPGDHSSPPRLPGPGFAGGTR
ncbi:PREDICTED: synaptobrevin-like [Nipponia nippon]|uniref:synaptobrevin-like n=1 Tax=Nipponia nippon TaxID=128390 RepID=UPI0005114B01|nr:PREDICTED: synaptobrevin-like [Nipponia nippon]